MKQVRLATANTRGSVMEPREQGKDAAVLKQPQLIFTKTGNYEVIVGHNLKSPSCEIMYATFVTSTTREGEVSENVLSGRPDAHSSRGLIPRSIERPRVNWGLR